jgi:hypothetical protein
MSHGMADIDRDVFGRGGCPHYRECRRALPQITPTEVFRARALLGGLEGVLKFSGQNADVGLLRNGQVISGDMADLEAAPNHDPPAPVGVYEAKRPPILRPKKDSGAVVEVRRIASESQVGSLVHATEVGRQLAARVLVSGVVGTPHDASEAAG